jgi:AraC family transcriptional regulator of arabinose operon
MNITTRRETGVPDYELLLAGCLHYGEDYAVLRSRGTRDWLIVYTVSGQGYFGHAGGQLIADQGKVVLVSPGTLHDYGTRVGAGHWEILWAHFHPRPHWSELMEWPETTPGLMSISIEIGDLRENVIHLFEDVIEGASSPITYEKHRALIRLEEILLECAAVNPMSSTRIDERVASAMNYMLGRLASPITLADIAKACHLSISRLGTLFRDQVGESPLQFLERRRFELAKQNLDLTSRTITDIALEVGFPDPLYFSLRFKKHTGMSPREYRRRESRVGEAFP